VSTVVFPHHGDTSGTLFRGEEEIMSLADEDVDHIKMLADKINKVIEAEGEKRLAHILSALMRAIVQHLLNASEEERESVEAQLPHVITFIQAGGTPEQADKMLRDIDAERRRAQMQLVPKPDDAGADS
jgi:hypothetical protein